MRNLRIHDSVALSLTGSHLVSLLVLWVLSLGLVVQVLEDSGQKVAISVPEHFSATGSGAAPPQSSLPAGPGPTNTAQPESAQPAVEAPTLIPLRPASPPDSNDLDSQSTSVPEQEIPPQPTTTPIPAPTELGQITPTPGATATPFPPPTVAFTPTPLPVPRFLPTPTPMPTPMPIAPVPDIPPANEQLAIFLQTDFGLVQPGQTVLVDIRVAASSVQPVDAAQVYLNYSPGFLQVLEIIPGSELEIILQSNVDSSGGEIDFASGTLGTSLQSEFTLATLVLIAVGATGPDGTDLEFAPLVAPRETKAVEGGQNALSSLQGLTLVVQ